MRAYFELFNFNRFYRTIVNFLSENLLFLTNIFVDESIVCYGMYGCFSKESPWINNKTRTVIEFPAHPSLINPIFCLKTRYNAKECQYLDYTNRSSIFRSYYTPNHKTYVVVHGFLDDGQKSWILVRNDSRVSQIHR